MTVTLRVRSIVWFFTGAALAVVVMSIVLFAMRVDAAPGDTDTTFVPITPCRIVDTRPAFQVGPRNTPLGTAETHTINAHGASGDCTIPSDAVGLSLNVTAVGATLPTFLTIWAADDPLPIASSLNPAPGQPPTPNAVTTDLSGSGSFNVYNLQGNVHVLADVNGYYTNSSLTELAARVADLEALTASMSTTTIDGHPTIRFTGVNVQVVDGTGDSGCSPPDFEACNGLGNLIVGYNESLGGDARTGSHNIVVGVRNDWTSYGGLVAGTSNTISGALATVTGGDSNVASGFASSVVGGWLNEASGARSSVLGGQANDAAGARATVSGGSLNTASGTESSVSGGASNIASGPHASVSGGEQNLASGQSASVAGGRTNWATGQQSSVSGGRNNIASGTRTKIVGGAGCTSNTSNGVLVGAVTGTTCTQIN